jgi:hypothetical protein
MPSSFFSSGVARLEVIISPSAEALKKWAICVNEIRKLLSRSLLLGEDLPDRGTLPRGVATWHCCHLALQQRWARSRLA